MEISIDESTLKRLMKEAFIEVLEDRKDVISEILSEVIEDIALAHAIKEGEGSKSVGIQEIPDILEGQP